MARSGNESEHYRQPEEIPRARRGYGMSLAGPDLIRSGECGGDTEHAECNSNPWPENGKHFR